MEGFVQDSSHVLGPYELDWFEESFNTWPASHNFLLRHDAAASAIASAICIATNGRIMPKSLLSEP